MAYNLADILNSLTLMQTAARRLLVELRKLEVDADQTQFVRDKAREAADELQAFLDGATLGSIAMEALKKLTDAVMTGKSIVQHQSTDTF